jgi:hypothetical protein
MIEGGEAKTFSISIEWENSRFAELGRTRRMLRRLREELIELSPRREPPEVLFLYDRFTIDGDLVDRVVTEEFQPQQTPAATRIVPTDHLRYYQQKNLGAALTRGQIVIFLDCDVVPERGWLGAMLAAFDDPAVDVVGGETYVELDGFLSRAFALFWLFSLRADDGDLAPARFFHANNVAFRREIFNAHGFPDLPIYRGQCTLLGDAIATARAGFFRLRGARVSHPYPSSFGYFIARALHGGRDWVLVETVRAQSGRIRLGRVWTDYGQRLRDARQRIGGHRSEVSLGRVGAVGAMAIAFVYLSLQAAGGALTLARPNLLPRLLPI